MSKKAGAAGLAALLLVAGCSATAGESAPPDLEPRGTALTTAKLERKDITATVSLDGKVELNPVYGVVAPVAGEVRYLDPPAAGPVKKATKVADVVADGKRTKVEIPAGVEFSGRLVTDKAKVEAGTPIASVRHGDYAVTADIDGAQAYTLGDGIASVRVQITGGPGPFDCAVLGTVAALPPGVIPPPPVDTDPPAAPGTDGGQAAPPQQQQQQQTTAPPQSDPSASTGMRLVCTAPAGTRMINGAAAVVEVVTAKATGVLTAPVEAVAGKQGRGKVDVLGPDGVRQTKDVELGLNDGKVVEIKSGLTGTETLAVPGPTISAPEPGSPGEAGKPGSR